MEPMTPEQRIKILELAIEQTSELGNDDYKTHYKEMIDLIEAYEPQKKGE